MPAIHGEAQGAYWCGSLAVPDHSHQMRIGRAPRPPRLRHRITTTRDLVGVIWHCGIGCGLGGWFRLVTRNRQWPVRPMAAGLGRGAGSGADRAPGADWGHRCTGGRCVSVLAGEGEAVGLLGGHHVLTCVRSPIPIQGLNNARCARHHTPHRATGDAAATTVSGTLGNAHTAAADAAAAPSAARRPAPGHCRCVPVHPDDPTRRRQGCRAGVDLPGTGAWSPAGRRCVGGGSSFAAGVGKRLDCTATLQQLCYEDVICRVGATIGVG